MNEAPAILIVEDDELTAEYYATQIEEHDEGLCIICTDERDVFTFIRERPIGLVLLDLNLPHIGGEEILENIASESPELPVIVITANDKVDTAVRCMKRGAFDYLAKPVETNRLVTAVHNAQTLRRLRSEVEALSEGKAETELRHPEVFTQIVTQSPEMAKLFRYMEAIASSPKAVLITGESGTGKELIARAVHKLSGRPGRFVPVNVSGLDETMFSDTLFGHLKGAYTGANNTRSGLVESAAEGTLFLDEIGDLPAGAQVKLLRLLQEGEYYPLGADRPEQARVRVVAATNAELRKKKETGEFRRDLYYRIMAHRVKLPALRERIEDLPLLVAHFIEEAAGSLGKPAPQTPPELLDLLSAYSFPGNVRELQAIIFDLVSRHDTGKLSLTHIRAYLRDQRESALEDESGKPISFSGSFPKLREVEDYLIEEALKRSRGNQTLAAELLGVSQSTLSRRLRKKEND
jgi:DNA-binding NtrC family response regulator